MSVHSCVKCMLLAQDMYILLLSFCTVSFRCCLLVALNASHIVKSSLQVCFIVHHLNTVPYNHNHCSGVSCTDAYSTGD